MPLDEIDISGARQHNLKNIDLILPGTGWWSSPACRARASRRLPSTRSTPRASGATSSRSRRYARQFLGQMDKPDVDYIAGLSPAISIDQKGASHNPRSTVGTVTEIYDYLRLLYARIGRPHCPKCGRPIQQQSVRADRRRRAATCPRARGSWSWRRWSRTARASTSRSSTTSARLASCACGSTARSATSTTRSSSRSYKKHTIEVVVDRLVVSRRASRETNVARIADSIEQALKLGSGQVIISEPCWATRRRGEDTLYSEHFACVYDGTSLAALEPRSFSFNSPHGACPTCTGLGTRLEVDPDLVMPNKDLSLARARSPPGARPAERQLVLQSLLESVAAALRLLAGHAGPDLKPEQTQDDPVRLEERAHRDALPEQERPQSTSTSATTRASSPTSSGASKRPSRDFIREDIERYMAPRPCPTCKGARLKPEALAVTIAGRTIARSSRLLGRSRARDFFTALEERVPYGDA